MNQPLKAAPSISYNLGRLDRLVHQQLSEVLAEHQVSLPQYTMLSNLYRSGATANAALAARSFVSPQAANQVVKVMLAQGWVSKRKSETHGRVVLIELTDEGLRVYERCAAAAQRFEKRLLAGFSAESVAQLKTILRGLLDNLR